MTLVSAAATGYVNAFVHKERLGWAGAAILAVLITGFVEKFYFTLRHGLVTIYKSGAQRLVATVCCRIIQGTMILNGAVLCAWVVGTTVPPMLQTWVRWSIIVHFSLALVGVAAVRETDAVVANRILELKSEAARQDILTVRKAAALGSPLVLFAAKLRGSLDGAMLARDLLRDKSGLPSESGQPPQNGTGTDGKRSGQSAQVISLFAAYPKPQARVDIPATTEVGNPATTEDNTSSDDQMGGQAAEWLKGVLPKSQTGWWEVAARGRGFTVKFRWRDPERQTLIFPQITGQQFDILRKSDYAEAVRITGEQIALHLRGLSLDPAKRDKALLAAQKLGIDLARK